MRDESVDFGRGSVNDQHSSWRVKWGGRLAAFAGRMRSLGGPLSSLSAMCAEAMAVGLMRRADVEELVTQTYHSRPEFYDPNRYELPYEQRMLPTLQKLRPSGHLLDAFCGQGREAKLFAQADYQVTAVDQLDWMIEAAKQYAMLEGFEADFQVDDFDQMVVSRPFDVVYTSCWMYSTVQSRKRRQAFLSQCYRLCDREGIIVLSHLGRSGDSTLGTRSRYLVAKLTAILTLGNFGTEIGERLYTGLFWHHLDDATVDQEIRDAGLRVIDRIPGTGMEPTFLFLAPRSVEVEEAEIEAR
ncbi:MAG: class I SAM-dependent methyltransferase [Planctomycetota bacterium]